MKLHPQVINNLIYLCNNFGGHKDEKRLLAALEQVRLAIYQSEAMSLCLVDAHTFVKERQTRNLPVNDIVPMKLHSTVLQKVLYAHEMFSGHSFETKLRNCFAGFDLTPYERKDTPGETVLVPTEEYMKTLQGVGVGT